MASGSWTRGHGRLSHGCSTPALQPHLLRDGLTDLGGSALGRGAEDRVTCVQGGPAWAQALCTRGTPHPGGSPSPHHRHLCGLLGSSPSWLDALLALGPSAFPPHPQQVGEGSVPGSPPSAPLPHLPGWPPLHTSPGLPPPSGCLTPHCCVGGSPTPHGNCQAPPALLCGESAPHPCDFTFLGLHRPICELGLPWAPGR